jgi:glycerol-3-phosphate O-acyltransferase
VVGVFQVLSYVAVALAAILAYEILRSILKRAIKRRFERDLQTFLQSPDLYAQHFKFTNKLVIKQQLLSDPEINRKILEFAEREKRPPLEVREKVEGYVDEIVPNFNLLSYYKLGYTIARAFIHLLYDPVADVQRRRYLDELPPRASPVYLMNHRSNVDFVLLAYVLAGKVSVSYAMGEWARVWPLEHLFKSFGSYLVRRGHKEDLYHKVLERYVQLSARHGVAQAVFPEGQITRDGRLLPPKLGLLQFLAGVEADPQFDRDLTFLPVGVNYDWVIEDHNLVAESEGRAPKKGWAKRLQVILTGPFVFLGLLVVNGVRLAAHRLKLHGYASISFGEPIVLKDWARARGVDLAQLTYEQRKPHIKALAEHALERVGRAVPATPVPLLSVGILDSGRTRFDRSNLIELARAARDELAGKGVRIVTGRAFEKFRHALVALDERGRDRERGSELDEIERALVADEQVETLVDFAIDVLRRNKILRRSGPVFEVRAERANFLRYYANSLAHHLGRAYPIAPESQLLATTRAAPPAANARQPLG